MAERIQRSRKKGWRMPEGAVYVGRPSRWGNPFAVSGCSEHGRMMATAGFRLHVEQALKRGETPGWVQEGWHSQATDDALTDPDEWLAPLRGRTLVCWCPVGRGVSCHADVLLAVANRPRLMCEQMPPAVSATGRAGGR